MRCSTVNVNGTYKQKCLCFSGWSHRYDLPSICMGNTEGFSILQTKNVCLFIVDFWLYVDQANLTLKVFLPLLLTES